MSDAINPSENGTAAHAVIASLVAQTLQPSPSEIVRVCAQHPSACRGSIARRMMVRARLVAASSSYFFNYPPGADWVFVGSEVRLDGARIDLLWKTPAGYVIDELKTSGLGGIDDPKIAAQVERELAAGRAAFGAAFYGVRLLHLGAPGGAEFIPA